jgi:hypothetical protein
MLRREETTKVRADGVAQAVRTPDEECKALSSNFSATKKKKIHVRKRKNETC